MVLQGWWNNFVSIYYSQREDQQDNHKHESIHIAQYIELLVIGFLILYLWDWVRGLIKYKDTNVAYRKIRLEQEAYEYQRSFTYLDKRERFAWKKYKV